MHTHRRFLPAVALLALVFCVLVAGSAVAGRDRHVSAPTDLHGFLTRPDEPRSQEFSRTPAFAWNPVAGAVCYEFELATAGNFTENSIVWSNVRYGVQDGKDCAATVASQDAATQAAATGDSGAAAAPATTPAPASTEANPAGGEVAPLRVPAVSIDLALPWFTGQPYSLHARVRAIGLDGPGQWSKPYSFNTRWPSVPAPMPTQTGMVRWTPIEGATGYQVWYQLPGNGFARFSTHTNVADLREYYTFFSRSPETVRWRVRAERRVFGDIPNGLPAVSHGPWSPIYTNTNPNPLPLVSQPLSITMGISDRITTPKNATSHQLMPAITWRGNQGLDGVPYILFRVYGFTDRDCVNPVYTGPVVGGPAYAPRPVGLLKLPASASEYKAAPLDYDVTQGAETRGADGIAVVSAEASPAAADSDSSSKADGAVTNAARVDLPDVDFPRTPYYFTVVPVTIEAPDFIETIAGGPPGYSPAAGGAPADGAGAAAATKPWVYRDVDLPQDACAAGRILALGKKSDPVVASSNGPNIAGLTPDGKLLAAKKASPTVYSTPLVSWRPAVGATAYEVQWSKTRYPWKAAGSKQTYSTSAILELGPGMWYYRVRGLNQVQKRKPEMTWSSPLGVRVATPTFRVVASSTSPKKAAAAKAKTAMAASTAKAMASIRAAVPAITAYRGDRGTYKGMTLAALKKIDRGLRGFIVRSATAKSFCVQSTVGRLLHVTGPTLQARLGSCGTMGKILVMPKTPVAAPTVSALSAAVPAIEAFRYDNDGYAGMTLAKLRKAYDAGIPAITIRSATKSSYCIEAAGSSLRGPGGSPRAGSCG